MRNSSPRVQKLVNQRTLAQPHELTYKSSLHAVCDQLGLVPYTIDLPPKQRAWRYIFASDEFISWMTNEVPNITLIAPLESETPKTQIETELFSFCYGRDLTDTIDIRCLDPKRDAVWELKTPDMRLFGWFPEKNYFLLHRGKEKELLQHRSDYEPFIDDVVKYRASLTSRIPNHVVGGLWDAVSNRPRPI